MRRSAWSVFLAVSGASILAYYLRPTTAVQDLIQLVSFASPVAAVWLGLRWNSPANRRAWLLIGGGFGAFAVGQTIWTYYEVLARVDVPYPSAGDAFFLLCAPSFAMGVFLLVRSGGLRDRAVFVDSVMATLAMGIVLWTPLIRPVIADASQPLLDRIVSVTYTVNDLILLSILAHTSLRGARRSASFWFVVASAGGLLFSDIGFAIGVAQGWYHTGSIVDVGWLIGPAMAGAAALHPSMNEVVALSEPPRQGSRRVAVLAAAMAAPVVMFLVEVLRHDSPLDPAIVGILMTGLLLWRVRGLIADEELRSGKLDAANAALERSLDLLREEEAARTRLMHEIVSVAERERARISHELHDGPIQRMAALALQVEMCDIDAVDREAIRSVFASGLKSEVGSLRDLVSRLRPPSLDEHGLAAALGDMAEHGAGATGVRVLVGGLATDALDPSEATTLYRVAQEAVANAVKHAAASQVTIALTDDSTGHRLQVSDDGRGFETATIEWRAESRHFGLAVMRERMKSIGGDLEVRSAPGQGTVVTAILPPERSRLAS